jgi:hypothetical protein
VSSSCGSRLRGLNEVQRGLGLVGTCVAVVGGGGVRVGPARAAAGPGYLKEVFERRLVEVIINTRAVDALVRDPLRWDLYLARDVVQGKKGAKGGGEELTGVGAAEEYLV